MQGKNIQFEHYNTPKIVKNPQFITFVTAGPGETQSKICNIYNSKKTIHT